MAFFDRLKSLVVTGMINAYVYLSAPRATVRAMIWKRGFPNPAYPSLAVDKYLWRKVFDRNPDFTAMSDKLAAKQIAQDICKDILVPKTMWTGERFQDIPDELLAGDVVLKANHGSGFHHFIRKGTYDPIFLERETRRWMSRDFSRYHGEWNYTGIHRKLFVEEFLKDTTGTPVHAEAKVYVFGSRALFAVYFHDRLSDHPTISLYDRSGKAYPIGTEIDMKCSLQPLPEKHQKIFLLAEKLAGAMDHVRVDIYIMDGSTYFSEFTFQPLAGRLSLNMLNAFPDANALWDLRKSWFLSHSQPGWRGAYAKWLQQKLACKTQSGSVPLPPALQD